MGKSWSSDLLAAAAERKTSQLCRHRQEVASPQGTLILRGGRPFVNFSSNDYLGLANDPEVKTALARAAETWGAGSGASHMVCGHMDPHHELERELADLVGAEKALLFSTGYMANLAIPSVFLNRQDLLLEDRLNHASLIDAGLLSRARLKRYRHLDSTHANEILLQEPGDRKMIMTDAVFSMDGDQAPISALKEIAEHHDALFVLDDAHGFGVLGTDGAGSLSAAGLRPSQNILMVGTLGKAAGTFGAFIAGDSVFIDTLLQHARPYIYTTAMPPAVAEATRTAIVLIRNQEWRREKLNENINRFRNTARKLGIKLVESETAIQPVLLGNESAALEAGRLLEAHGIIVVPIRPPTVPAGTSRLRITLSALHTTEDIERLTDVLGSSAFLALGVQTV